MRASNWLIAEPLTSRLYWSTATKVWGADDLGGGAPSPLLSVPRAHNVAEKHFG
jgi:hypothetical protein